MFNLHEWEVGGHFRVEEELRRAAHARLLAEAKRSRPARPGIRRRALHTAGALLIAAGRMLQGAGKPNVAAPANARPEPIEGRPVYAC
jgi:hypothetical protein